jgi:hypothetical protein
LQGGPDGGQGEIHAAAILDIVSSIDAIEVTRLADGRWPS